jgi:hypothetical protein
MVNILDIHLLPVTLFTTENTRDRFMIYLTPTKPNAPNDDILSNLILDS